MPIRAGRLKRPFAVAALALLCASCDGSPDGAMLTEEAAAATPVPSPPTRSRNEHCLMVVWQNQKQPNQTYDRAHDHAEGGAISCTTTSSASQFRNAISALRTAAKTRNKSLILKETGLPLLHIDGHGKSHPLQSAAAVDAAFDDVFDARTLDALSRIDLDHMTVVPHQGGFFDLGALWLVVPKPGDRPRLMTVNHQALAESAAADKAAAEKTAAADKLKG